jgi:hypothetical protein
MKTLPPNFVRIDSALLIRLLRTARASGQRLHETLEDVTLRGLASLEADKQRIDPLEADWFAHLAESAPQDLEPWQRRVLEQTYNEDGLWVYPSAKLGDIEEGRAPEPYISIEALRRAWPALVRRASQQNGSC